MSEVAGAGGRPVVPTDHPPNRSAHEVGHKVAPLLLTESQYTDMSSVRRTVDTWLEGALAARTGDEPESRRRS